MMRHLNFNVIICLLGIGSCVHGLGCEIDLDDETLQKTNSKGKFPLIVNATGDIIYPVGEKKLKFDSDDTVSTDKLPQIGFYCHRFDKKGKIKSKVSSSSIKPLKNDAAYVPLRCNNDGTFSLFNEGMDFTETVDVNKVSCTTNRLYPVLKKDTDGTALCSDVGADGRTDDLLNTVHYVEIGWNMSAMTFVDENHFAPTEIKDMIQLCVDEKVYGTIWTRHLVRGASIKFQDKGGARHKFKTDNPYRPYRYFDGLSSTKVKNMYKKTAQKKMETFYGLKDVINTSSSSQDWFSKGHLSPDAAFVYQREQDATYYYINAAPQFQSFNAQNWRFLEEGARELAQSLKRDVLTYTGTLGVLNYTTDNDLYLWYKKQRKSDVTKGIPVPKYYWKIVYDEKENQGVGFLGLNDPHSKNLTETDYLCNPNVCDQIGWFEENVPNKDVEEKGHVTCCSIEDLAKIVPNVGNFKTDQGKSISNNTTLLTCNLTCKLCKDCEEDEDCEADCKEEIADCNLCEPLV